MTTIFMSLWKLFQASRDQLSSCVYDYYLYISISNINNNLPTCNHSKVCLYKWHFCVIIAIKVNFYTVSIPPSIQRYVYTNDIYVYKTSEGKWWYGFNQAHMELSLTPFGFSLTMIKPSLTWGLVWPGQTKPNWTHIGLGLTTIKPSPNEVWFDSVKPNLTEPLLGSGLTPLGLSLTMVKPSPNGVWFDLVISNQIEPALGLVWLILDSVWPRSNLAKHRALFNPIKSNLTEPNGLIWFLLGFFFFLPSYNLCGKIERI